MKKAKIVLSVIAAFALTGAGLAFKASRNTFIVYYICNTSTNPNTCVLTAAHGFDLAATSSVLRTQFVPSGTTELDQPIQGLDCANNGVLDCTSSFFYATCSCN